MKKIKLLLAAAAAVFSLSTHAQFMEVDYTSRLNTNAGAGGWVGASGMCATRFAPAITTKDGRFVQLAENYQENVNATGDLITQTVTGLANGTYRVSIYANAFYTSNRGFTSDLVDGAEDVCYVFAGTGENRVEKFITAHIAESTTENDLRVLNDVVVEDGTLVVGLGKAKAGTNWHTVQVYEITAIVDLSEIYDRAMADYEEVTGQLMEIAVSEELEEAKAAVDEEVTDVTLNRLNDAVAAAQASVKAFAEVETKLAAMKDVIDATNFYTQDALDDYYTFFAEAFENGTLTTEEANSLQDPSLVTGWHANITVDNFLLSVWDAEPDVFNGYYINSWSVEGDTDGSDFRVPFFEYWTVNENSLGARTLTAVLEDVEPGDYAVEIWARVRQADEQTKADGSITMSVNGGAAADLTVGQQVGSSPFYLDYFTAYGKVAEDGVLTLTINVAENSGISWLSFKNVFYSPADNIDDLVLSQLQEQVQARIETLQAIEEGTVPASTFSTLQGLSYEDLALSVELYDDAVEGWTAALETVNLMLADAQAQVAAYPAYQQVRAIAEELAAVEYVELASNAHLNLENALKLQDADKYTYAAEDITEMTGLLEEAVVTYIGVANPAEGAQFDLTFLLSNPDVTDLWTGNWGVKPEGWYNEQQGGNFQVMANEAMAPGGEIFMEYWSKDPATSGFTLYQSVELPSGTYLMTGRVGAQENEGGEVTNISFSANETDGTQIAYGPLQDASIEFVQQQQGEVHIGLKAHAGNNTRWMAINDIHLYKVAERQPVDLNEDVAYIPESVAADVNINREVKQGYNTVVLPVSLSEDQVADFFGQGSVVYSFADEVDEENGVISVNFTAKETNTVQAGVPVLVAATEARDAAVTFTVPSATVAGSAPQTISGSKVEFVGVYAPTEIPAGDYFISGDKFFRSTGAGSHVKAFRAYFAVKPEAEEVAEVKLLVNGETTAINALNAAAGQQGAIFNLAGQQVSKAVKGIYVSNGKKFIVK